MGRLYWITIFVTAGYGILLCLARREEPPKDAVSFLKPFYKIAMYLYRKISRIFPKLFSSQQVEKDLLQLYPGESGECLKTGYYGKKAAISLAVIFAGTLVGAAAKYSAASGILLGEDGIIVRNGYREGSKEFGVTADYGQRQLDFTVKVEPLLLSGEEAEALMEEFCAQLPQAILGKNESLEKVSSNLALEWTYGDYPVSVSWESNQPGILSSEGQVFSVGQAQQVTLTAHLTYGSCERTEELSVTVVPPELSEDERIYQEMEEMLRKSQAESVWQEEWRLPKEWQGEGIRWSQSVDDQSMHLWGAAMAAAVMVFFFLDKDLHEQLEKRKKSMRRAYPEIIHQLALFVGAGMTVRGALQKIAGDYEAKCRGGDRRLPAYEEVLYTCRELHSGISESLCYEHFGRRTGLQEYIRLSTLLAQNLKRGNSTLLERLRDEADKAAEERLQQSKKLGEEAGTKLLIPMVLMLAVVMAVIMIPAMSNM